MLKRALILKLFEAFSIVRWNDHIRPIPLVEMDKNAHKMAIAYCLGKYEEDQGAQVNWTHIIQGGVFELLRRCIISDIKSPIYRKIRENDALFAKLNQSVYQQAEPLFENRILLSEFQAFLDNGHNGDTLSKDILTAAHRYASYWEFQIIRRASPDNDRMRKINNMLLLDLADYRKLTGIKKLLDCENIVSFVEMFGQLRFQIRWGQTPRLPITSVLGHCMMVATISYLLIRELDPEPCAKRLRNDFFGGLFHDLPECVTRDIVSPVKTSVQELKEVLAQIESELVEKEIYPYIEDSWKQEFDYYSKEEFKDKIYSGGNVIESSTADINGQYNTDEFNPIDGSLIKAADQLSAFVEAYISAKDGFSSATFGDAKTQLKENNRAKMFGNISIGGIFADFD